VAISSRRWVLGISACQHQGIDYTWGRSWYLFRKDDALQQLFTSTIDLVTQAHMTRSLRPACRLAFWRVSLVSAQQRPLGVYGATTGVRDWKALAEISRLELMVADFVGDDGERRRRLSRELEWALQPVAGWSIRPGGARRQELDYHDSIDKVMHKGMGSRREGRSSVNWWRPGA